MACQEFRKEVDAIYPEPLSRLHRGPITSSLALDVHPLSARRIQRKPLHKTAGSSGRYRTQPVTFDEIKEVDEEVSELEQPSAASEAQSEEDLMQRKFHQMRLRSRNRNTRKPAALTSKDETSEQEDLFLPTDSKIIGSSHDAPAILKTTPRPSI